MTTSTILNKQDAPKPLPNTQRDGYIQPKDLLTFRTQVCPQATPSCSSRCDQKIDCAYSHCITWPRRNPSIYKYEPKICPNVTMNRQGNRSQLKVTSACKKGYHCSYAHTQEEMFYHPQLYKSKLCRSWHGIDHNDCPRRYCPYAHGETELRYGAVSSIPTSTNLWFNPSATTSYMVQAWVENEVNSEWSHDFNVTIRLTAAEAKSMISNAPLHTCNNST